MKRRVVLTIDLLGSRARWHAGGRAAAERAFKLFRELIAGAVQEVESSAILTGVIENDSTLIVCETLQSAIRIARHAYRSAFLAPGGASDHRLWLRGAVVPFRGVVRLRAESQLIKKYKTLRVVRYTPSALNAIASEKAGFKGMRLLVGGGEGVGERARRRALTVLLKGHHYSPFLTARTPLYPRRLAQRKFKDFIWMATEDPEDWSRLKSTMAERLRWAAADPEEFLQAAATQVIFNHWRAFVNSLQLRE